MREFMGYGKETLPVWWDIRHGEIDVACLARDFP